MTVLPREMLRQISLHNYLHPCLYRQGRFMPKTTNRTILRLDSEVRIHFLLLFLGLSGNVFAGVQTPSPVWQGANFTYNRTYGTYSLNFPNTYGSLEAAAASLTGLNPSTGALESCSFVSVISTASTQVYCDCGSNRQGVVNLVCPTGYSLNWKGLNGSYQNGLNVLTLRIVCLCLS